MRGRPRLEVRDTPPCEEESEEEVLSAFSSAVSSPCPSQGWVWSLVINGY